MQKRYIELDGLRGIAVILVVIHHSVTLFELDAKGELAWKLALRFLAVGWFGVDVFFALSGFLITGILLKQNRNPRGFYQSRAFRILPAFLLVFFVTTRFVHTSGSTVAAYLLFLGNFTVLNGSEVGPLYHFWSLAVEEQFYVFWPQLAWRVSRDRLLKVALSLACISVLLRIVEVGLGVRPNVLYKLTPTHLDGIALGCALAIALQNPAANAWLRRRWQTVFRVSALVLLGGFVSLKFSYFVGDVRAQLIAIPTVSVLSCCIIYGATQGLLSRAWTSVLGGKAFVYFGHRSYGLYLIHVPVFSAIRHLEYRTAFGLSHPGRIIHCLLALTAMVASLLLTEVSWRVVESPAQDLRRWLQARASERTAAAA